MPWKMRSSCSAPLAALVSALQLAVGCATTPYPFAAHGETSVTLPLGPDEPQIERGAPNGWVDGFGHYFFSLPAKLILLDWKVDNHDIPPEVEQSLLAYLHANGLCKTKVRLNQYAPGAEWKRLFKNTEMPVGWRYTLGLISVAFYTIFPERLFAGFPFIGGGDHYNPYTNTVSIFSGSRPIVLHEGGHAKDFAAKESRQWKGLYAGARAVPLLGLGVALWQEAVASNDALSWDLATAGSRESKAAYRTLYPAYSTYVGGTAETAANLFTGGWILYAIQYGTVVVGHVAGQTRAAFVAERQDGIEPRVLDGAPVAAGADAAPGEESLRELCGEPVPDEPGPGTPEPLPSEAEPVAPAS